jgi:hypothetical protein
MQGKCIDGWPQFYFFLVSWELWIPFGVWKATLDNFEVWSIFGGQAYKCHMGWKPRCIIFLEQFNQNVIWQSDSWYVWGETKTI